MRFAILLFGLILTIKAMAFSYTIEVPEAEIQERISAMMPVEATKYFVTLTVSDATVNLLDNTDEVSLYAELHTSVPGGLKGSGNARVKGSVVYDPTVGAFYFRQPYIEEMKINYVPERFVGNIKRLTQIALEQVLNKYPVYTFKETNRKHKLAKSMLKEVKVDGKILYLTLSPF